MKNFFELSLDARIDFIIRVLDIDEDEVDNFIKYANMLYEYGAFNSYELSTLDKIADKVLDILVKENTFYCCLADVYTKSKEIVDKIDELKKINKNFNIQNILDFAKENE